MLLAAVHLSNIETGTGLTGAPKSLRRPRTLYAYWRFAQHLLKEFRWPLGVFAGLVLGGGLILRLCYRPALGYPEACHAIFIMTFFEQELEFPRGQWYLQPLFFLIPIVGLGAIADSIVRLGYLVFARKEKLQEWNVIQAEGMRNHIVVVGAGKVGHRITIELLALKEPVVCIDKNMESPLVAELLDLGVPIIEGECRLRRTLELAGVDRAKAVICATDDDLANLDAALTSREIKPSVQVVLRLFDETLATKVAAAFKMPAISPSVTSAPVFIAAATGRSVLSSFTLDGTTRLHVADVCVDAASPMAGQNVGKVQERFGVNIIMHQREGRTRVNPEHALLIEANDRMLVIAPIERIADLDRRPG
jgi:voltage-gated potassium channel